jgi:hypothetical protein
MNHTYHFNENKILNLLDELDQDRSKLFTTIKTDKESDKISEDKVRCIETIQKNLIMYKKILNKEKTIKDT